MQNLESPFGLSFFYPHTAGTKKACAGQAFYREYGERLRMQTAVIRKRNGGERLSVFQYSDFFDIFAAGL